MTNSDKEFYLVNYYNVSFMLARDLLKYNSYDLGAVVDYIKDNGLDKEYENDL